MALLYTYVCGNCNEDTESSILHDKESIKHMTCFNCGARKMRRVNK